MELKIKYHYTYFIKPFLIKAKSYKEYLLSLLKNKKCRLKIFEKARDCNLYNYFIQNIREYFFPTFLFNSDKIKELDKMNNGLKSSILANFHCNIFEYNLDSKIQGKVNNKEGVFFNIEKIEIICLDTGICFLVMKTNIENTDKFSDLLDFNFKFKDINSDFDKLKSYNNIKIQTDMFENMSELSDFINDITGVNSNIEELKGIDLYNKRFFTFTYCCIDQEHWNTIEDFQNIENDFIKYSNVLSNENTLEFNAKELEKNIIAIEPYKYATFGFTKQSSVLLTSSIDMNNYNKILFDYEHEIFYTLLISLYQRIYLKKIENDFRSKNNMNDIRKNFSKYTKEIWHSEITNSLTGTYIYNKWKEIFELEAIYSEIKNKYDVIYKEVGIEKNNKINKIILISLIISLILNIINFIALFKFI